VEEEEEEEEEEGAGHYWMSIADIGT